MSLSSNEDYSGIQIQSGKCKEDIILECEKMLRKYCDTSLSNKPVCSCPLKTCTFAKPKTADDCSEKSIKSSAPNKIAYYYVPRTNCGQKLKPIEVSPVCSRHCVKNNAPKACTCSNVSTRSGFCELPQKCRPKAPTKYARPSDKYCCYPSPATQYQKACLPQSIFAQQDVGQTPNQLNIDPMFNLLAESKLLAEYMNTSNTYDPRPQQYINQAQPTQTQPYNYQQQINQENANYQQQVNRDVNYQQQVNRDANYQQQVNRDANYQQQVNRDANYQQQVNRENANYQQQATKESANQQQVNQRNVADAQNYYAQAQAAQTRLPSNAAAEAQTLINEVDKNVQTTRGFGDTEVGLQTSDVQLQSDQGAQTFEAMNSYKTVQTPVTERNHGVTQTPNYSDFNQSIAAQTRSRIINMPYSVQNDAHRATRTRSLRQTYDQSPRMSLQPQNIAMNNQPRFSGTNVSPPPPFANNQLQYPNANNQLPQAALNNQPRYSVVDQQQYSDPSNQQRHSETNNLEPNLNTSGKHMRNSHQYDSMMAPQQQNPNVNNQWPPSEVNRQMQAVGNSNYNQPQMEQPHFNDMNNLPEYGNSVNRHSYGNSNNQPRYPEGNLMPQYNGMNNQPRHSNVNDQPPGMSMNNQPRYSNVNDQPPGMSMNNQPRYSNVNDQPPGMSMNNQSRYVENDQAHGMSNLPQNAGMDLDRNNQIPNLNQPPAMMTNQPPTEMNSQPYRETDTKQYAVADNQNSHFPATNNQPYGTMDTNQYTGTPNPMQYGSRNVPQYFGMNEQPRNVDNDNQAQYGRNNLPEYISANEHPQTMLASQPNNTGVNNQLYPIVNDQSMPAEFNNPQPTTPNINLEMLPKSTKSTPSFENRTAKLPKEINTEISQRRSKPELQISQPIYARKSLPFAAVRNPDYSGPSPNEYAKPRRSYKQQSNCPSILIKVLPSQPACITSNEECCDAIQIWEQCCPQENTGRRSTTPQTLDYIPYTDEATLKRFFSTITAQPQGYVVPRQSNIMNTRKDKSNCSCNCKYICEPRTQGFENRLAEKERSKSNQRNTEEFVQEQDNRQAEENPSKRYQRKTEDQLVEEYDNRQAEEKLAQPNQQSDPKKTPKNSEGIIKVKSYNPDPNTAPGSSLPPPHKLSKKMPSNPNNVGPLKPKSYPPGNNYQLTENNYLESYGYVNSNPGESLYPTYNDNLQDLRECEAKYPCVMAAPSAKSRAYQDQLCIKQSNRPCSRVEIQPCFPIKFENDRFKMDICARNGNEDPRMKCCRKPKAKCKGFDGRRRSVKYVLLETEEHD